MKLLPSLIAALAVALPLACGDGGEVATAPELEELGAEGVSAAEIATAAFLDDLSEEDRAAIRAALQAAREEIRAIVARYRDGEIDRAEARAEIDAVHDALLDTLSEFLTDEQIDRLLDRLRDHRPPGRPDLDLTDEQIAAIRELHQEFKAFVRELKADLDDGVITPEAARAALREEARATRAAFCAILTEAQQAEVRFCGGSD